MNEKLLTKLTSGRFILTIVCAVLLAWGALIQYFPADKVLDIIVMIVVFYFAKHRIDDK